MANSKTKPKVEDIARALAEPVCAELGCELFDVEYQKEGSEWYLRFFIDRIEPVDHDLCHAVSQRLSDVLDEADPISNAYFLEVSSPGLERPLRKFEDFQRFAGEKIMIRLFAPQNGQKEFSGILMPPHDDVISIEVKIKNKTTQYDFKMNEIAKAHLLFDFNN